MWAKEAAHRLATWRRRGRGRPLDVARSALVASRADYQYGEDENLTGVASRRGARVPRREPAAARAERRLPRDADGGSRAAQRHRLPDMTPSGGRSRLPAARRRVCGESTVVELLQAAHMYELPPLADAIARIADACEEGECEKDALVDLLDLAERLQHANSPPRRRRSLARRRRAASPEEGRRREGVLPRGEPDLRGRRVRPRRSGRRGKGARQRPVERGEGGRATRPSSTAPSPCSSRAAALYGECASARAATRASAAFPSGDKRRAARRRGEGHSTSGKPYFGGCGRDVLGNRHGKPAPHRLSGSAVALRRHRTRNHGDGAGALARHTAPRRVAVCHRGYRVS